MKNFLRALRYAWPYKFAFTTSVCFALVAAALWGLMFTTTQPMLKLLGTGKSLHTWIDDRIQETQLRIDGLEVRIDHLSETDRALHDAASSKQADRRRKELSLDLVKVETKLQSARSEMRWLQYLHYYVYRYLPTDCFRTLMWVIALGVGSVVLRGFFEFGQETLVGGVVNRSLFDVRNDLYRNVIHLDVGQFTDQGTSEFMTRFTNDVEVLGTGLKGLFGRVIAEPLRAVACFIFACWISWQLTLLFAIGVPVALFTLRRLAKLMKRATRRLLEHMSTIYKILQESLQGMRVVKAFRLEGRMRHKYRTATENFLQKAMLVVKIDALTGPIMEIFGVLTMAAALIAGAYLVLQKETHLFGMRMSDQPLEAESLMQLYLLLAAVSDPIRKLSSVYTKLQAAEAAAERVFQVMDRFPKITSGEGMLRVQHSSTIEFRDVCFSYRKEVPILSHISATVRFGEIIAVVGHNGCGKSTLLNLLPRFYDPDHGSILLDGHDLRSLSLRSLRQQISIVSQDTFLFDDTIFNNIAVGRRRADQAQVEEAAKAALAHEFIDKLTEGYQQRVAEGSTNLSGGQKQRIALARALLQKPRILVLDEFTSQTDTTTEISLHRQLKELKSLCTMFIITHRMSTLEVADRIIVLDQGHVVALGTHAELLANCPVYGRLHEAQGQRLVA